MRASAIVWGAAIAAVGPLASTALGNAINIQFAGTTYTGYSAAASGTTYTTGSTGGTSGVYDNGKTWNNMGFTANTGNFTGTGSATTYSNGQAIGSAVGVSITIYQGYSGSGGGEYSQGSGTDGGPSPLLDYYLFSRSYNGDTMSGANAAATASTFTVSNIPAGTYDVYLYSEHGNATFTSAEFSIDGGAFESATENSTISDKVFQDGTNYVVFDSVAITGTLTGSWQYYNNVNNEEADFNGITLVAVPEPASAALIFIAAPAILARRRRCVAG